MVKLGDLCKIETGKRDANHGNPNGEYHFFTCAKDHSYIDSFAFDTEALLIAGNGDVGAIKYFKGKFDAYQRTYVLFDFQEVSAKYLYHILSLNLKKDLDILKQGNTMPYIKLGMLTDYLLPLPPLEVQEQIVTELDGYAAIISGAKQIFENWKPSIDVDSEWNSVLIGDIAEVKGGKRLPKGEKFSQLKTKYPYIRVTDFQNGTVDVSDLRYVSKEQFDSLSRYTIAKSDVYISIAGTIGLVGKVPDELDGQLLTENAAKITKLESTKVNQDYLIYILQSEYCTDQIKRSTQAVGVPKLGLEKITQISIPLPDLGIQNEIVAKIESEKSQVDSAKKLVETYEARTQTVIAKLWSE